MVRLTKKVLKQALGRSVPTFEILLTFLGEAEAIINSRPITFIYEENTSLRFLRPIDFLIPFGMIGTENLEENQEDQEYIPTLDSVGKVIKFWKSSQKYIDKCWELFQREYLLSLHERYQNVHKQGRSLSSKKPKPGTVVLLQEEGLPRGSWKMAIIQSLIEGPEGISAVKIKTPNGHILNRPINLLHPLEIEVDINEIEENEHINKDEPKLEKRVTRSMARRQTANVNNNALWTALDLG